MRTEKLQLSDIRYNPEAEAFEALVKIHDHGQVFAYPAQLRAPLSADFARIAEGLSERARQSHRAPELSLRLRRHQPRQATPPRSPSRLEQLPFMQMVLRKLAA